MKKTDVLSVIDRRIHEAHEIVINPETPHFQRERAAGAYHALLQVKFEIEDKGTKREGRDYLTIA